MLVSVAMIVRDEEQNIERALRSVLPVADEIVILDTGSEDATKEIITKIGSNKIKLHDHEWKDDFSEARNASIALCKGDWVFIYDGDEELTEEAQKGLRPFLEAQPQEVNTVYMITRNIVAEGMSDALALPRIFRRGTISYKYAVHNRPQYEGESVKTDFVSNHYGYQWTPELRAKKQKRLARMMEKIIGDETLNEQDRIYYRAQYYKTLLVCEKKEEAFAYGIDLVEDAKKSRGVPTIMHDAFVLLGLQALEYRDLNTMQMCVSGARTIDPESPDSYMLEALMFNAAGQPLNVLRAYETYAQKVETFDVSTCYYTLQHTKYHDAVLVVAAKAAYESGMNDRSAEILEQAHAMPTALWAIDELVVTLSNKAHAKVLGLFEPEILRLTKEQPINISKYYSRLYGEAGREMATTRKKVAIIAAPGLDSFLPGVRKELGKRYVVQTVLTSDIANAVDYIDWADLVWYEFGNELAIAGTNKHPAKKTVVRLHAYEAYNGMTSNINYANVDCVMIPANHIRELVGNVVPEGKIAMIPMGVDTRRFSYAKRGHGYNIAFAGNINARKNPMMTIQIVNQLVKIDPRYNLSWAGELQDLRLWKYLEHVVRKLGLENNVRFIGPQKDVNAFLEDKNYFLSTSFNESTGMAILEAGSKGIRPIIHTFWGATDVYPEEYLFASVDEAVRMILAEEYDSERYRAHAEEHSEEKQLILINEAIANLFQEEVTAFD